jgi:hypothetical protein
VRDRRYDWLYERQKQPVKENILTRFAGELADELRLNREYLRDVVGAPDPRHPGAFPMEGSIDAHKLAGFRGTPEAVLRREDGGQVHFFRSIENVYRVPAGGVPAVRPNR